MHAVVTIGMLAALVLGWRDAGVRRLVLLGLTAYVVMRAWSFAYFIPEMLAFQEVPLDRPPTAELSSRVDRWTSLSWLRLPLDLVAAISFLFALTRGAFGDGLASRSSPIR